MVHRALLLHHPRGVWVRDVSGADVEVLTGPLFGQGVEPALADLRACGQEVPAKPAENTGAPCVARGEKRAFAEVCALPDGDGLLVDGPGGGLGLLTRALSW